MAKSIGDITIVGTQQGNAATIRLLGLDGALKGRGTLDAGDIEVINLTPELAKIIAEATAKRLAKLLARESRRPQRPRR